MSFVRSMLSGVTDVVKIAELLDAIKLTPELSKPSSQYGGYTYGYRSQNEPRMDPAVEEFSQLLAVVFQVSTEGIETLVATNDAELLMRLNAPALVAIVHSQQPPSTELLALLLRVRAEVHKRTPTERTWAMPNVKLNGGNLCCNECTVVQEFIETTERTKTITLFKYKQKHFGTVISRSCENLVTYRCDKQQ